jgi:hypothetical protein
MSSKSKKFFVFQSGLGGIQTEIGRKQKGAGRTPVGPNITVASDGNVYVTDCTTEKPEKVAEGYELISTQTDSGTDIFYSKPRSGKGDVIKKFALIDGKLVDQGVAGRGRPARGYVKIEVDTELNGVQLKGHFYNDGTTPAKAPKKVKAPVVVADPVVDTVEVDLESQAAADAAADMASEGIDLGDFEEVEIDEEVEV